MEDFNKSLYLSVLFVVATECFENLSQLPKYSGVPTQSVSYRYPAVYTADKAVDGYLQQDLGEDTCSITFANSHIHTAWWKFPLKRLANVAYLTIFFRNSTVNRHTGFSVYVFNDSSFTPPYGFGERVYSHDPSTCPQVQMNITVNKVTQGCPLQHHGMNCRICSPRCRDRHCDMLNGSCTNGCSNAFMTPKHCACVSGRYGTICEEVCGKCLKGTNCDEHSGICHHGCKENWQGAKCDECQDHKYGPNCVFDCGHCRNKTACSKTDGTCEEGCQSGWSEPLCMKKDWVMMTPSLISLAGSTLFVVTLVSIGVQILCRRRKWKRLSKKSYDKCSKELDPNEDTVRYISGRADLGRDVHKYNDMTQKEYTNDKILIYENTVLY
ncbi:platelet endothelial aggregation receptor 1-like [Saccostrea cucullata]|uniref:platelet endothelial aggregation receptor 1-like n=1 Tax=Saccostrea cuccullata TaxID=36930 RepID=UPI002ECFBB2F